jgi:adenylyltransferase/sulfurtransferase
MGALPGLIGSIQAIEAIKHILGGAQTLLGRLLFLDAWLMEFTEMPLDKDPNCPICGPKPTITELIDYEVFCDLNPKELKAPGLTAQEFKEKLAQGEPLQIIDLREAQEREIWPIPQALPIAYVDLSQRYVELNPQIETVVVCEIGQKSLFAIRALKKAGYQGSLFNLINGARALTQINEN